jgi:hypothetical protein
MINTAITEYDAGVLENFKVCTDVMNKVIEENAKSTENLMDALKDDLEMKIFVTFKQTIAN